MSETNRKEYKRELNADVDVEKEVIAFLNYPEGGLTLHRCRQTWKGIGGIGSGRRYAQNQRPH